MKRISKTQLKRLINEEISRAIYEICSACNAAESDITVTGYPEEAGCGGFPDSQGDIDWEGPSGRAAVPRISDLESEEAFALGFQMGQSGEFDDTLLEKKGKRKTNRRRGSGRVSQYPYSMWYAGDTSLVGKGSDYERDDEDYEFDVGELGMTYGYDVGGGFDGGGDAG